MDHDMHDMDMSMGSMGMFSEENEYRAHILWYLIAAWIGILTLLRISTSIQSITRRRQASGISSRPSNRFEQLVATFTAIYREVAYPQPIWFTGRLSKYFTPLPVGRTLLLACYWIVILTLLWSDVILESNDPMYPYKWEKVGFRAAWISVAQIPFVYLLSCKFNPISLLTGISYERYNWLHRWAARTVFLTAIVHWSYFFQEWVLADFVEVQLEMMPMVKYGFGAWAVVGWMVVSGSGFFRAASYELFVIQHIFAAAVLLWLIFAHIPAYAMYNIWLSIGFVAFDWSFRILLALLRNTHILGRVLQAPGYSSKLESLPGDITRLTIDAIDFKWRAGQHIYLSIPSLRPFELHPFTIASSAIKPNGERRALSLLIKAHSGFSKSLHRKSHRGNSSYRVFLNGPFGNPPDVSHHDIVVLVACSTGITFTLPILQDLLSKKICARHIVFHWIVRSEEHIAWFRDALSEAQLVADAANVRLSINVHVTNLAKPDMVDQTSTTKAIPNAINPTSTTKTIPSTTAGVVTPAESTSSSELEKVPAIVSRVPSGDSTSSSISTHRGQRPQLNTLLRPAVESALGETAVVACGGMSFTAQIRTYVAALSDERAVHKGSGAQGIFLFTETYGWG